MAGRDRSGISSAGPTHDYNICVFDVGLAWHRI
jgi:hypothetical protein